MDDGELPALAHVGVRVDVGRGAVGRPAGVADADAALNVRAAVDHVAEHLQPALGLLHLDLMARRHHRDAGGVISAILQSGKPVQQDRRCLLLTDKTNDSTHMIRFSFYQTIFSQKRTNAQPFVTLSPGHSPFVLRLPAYLSAVYASGTRGSIRRNFDPLPASSALEHARALAL